MREGHPPPAANSPQGESAEIGLQDTQRATERGPFHIAPKAGVILLLRFCLLFGLPILLGETPTYKRDKESLVTHPSTETLPGMFLENQA